MYTSLQYLLPPYYSDYSKPSLGPAVVPSTAYPKKSGSPRNTISRAKEEFMCLIERANLRFEKTFCDFFERVGKDIA